MVDPENLKKMSNDEIIECCSNIADWGFNDYEEWEQQSAVYGLLDLYKKQQKELEGQGLRLLELAHKLTFDYISKNKIREKIQDLKETISRMDIEDIGRMLREEQILILEEILEGE